MSKKNDPGDKRSTARSAAAGRDDYISPLFRKSNIDKALTLAIRGVPMAWQPDEWPVDLNLAREIYAEEIRQLDALHPRRKLFPSGILGGALIGLALDPGCIEFWDRYNEGEWTRHADGRIDPVGILWAEVTRHTGHRVITLRADYQHYLFQTALGAVRFYSGTRARGVEPWLTDAPPLVSVPDLLLEVRTQKRIRLNQYGFRSKDSLTGRVPLLRQAEIIHQGDFGLVQQIARRACRLPRFACSRRRQRRVLRTLQKLTIPSELAAPGALAAAVVSIGHDAGNEIIWRDAFDGRWSRLPGQGTDVAGQLVQAIRTHNRQPHGIDGELELMARCCMAIKSHHRMRRTSPNPRLFALPRAARDMVEGLRSACADLELDECPTVHHGYIEPYARSNRKRRKPCSKPPQRGKTGRSGEQSFARLHARLGWPRPGRLIDRTAEQCGYDYGIVECPDADEWEIEVKTVRAGKQLQLTERQWERAQEVGDLYWLVLVLMTADGERFGAIRNPTAVLPAREHPVVIRQMNQVVSAKDWAQILEGQWHEFEEIDEEVCIDQSREDPDHPEDPD